MKRLLLLTVSALAALALPGCLQNETTVHLKKDGSGTVVEKTTFGGQVVAMLEQMSAMGGEDAKDPFADMFSEEKAKARAATMGEGVTFEKAEAIKAAGSKGAVITYRFEDINKLRVAAGDGMKEMGSMAGADEATTEKANRPVTFTYADGSLNIIMPEPDKIAADVKPEDADAAKADLDAMGDQEKAMMKQMLGDMKITFQVVIDSGIEETDASLRDGNTITLMSMEMGKLLENPESFKKLQSMDQNADPSTTMEALKGIDGVKMETKPKITVKVK